MQEFEFAIIATGLDPQAEDFADSFYEAGCDDALVGFQRGVIVVDFIREAVTLDDAIRSAIDAVRMAGATVLRIEPDHLVNLTDIAERADLTRQAVALYANGKRGQNFPTPTACVTTDHPLYDWREVAEWLATNGKIDEAEVERAHVIKAFNDEIDGVHAEGQRELLAA